MSHGQIRQIGGPHLIGPLDRQTIEQVRVDLRVARGNAGSRPAIQRLDGHAAHQGRHVDPADVEAFPLELLGQPAGTVERVLQVQLIDPTHNPQILLAYRTRRVVHAGPVEPEKFTLARDAQLCPPGQSSSSARAGEATERGV